MTSPSLSEFTTSELEVATSSTEPFDSTRDPSPGPPRLLPESAESSTLSTTLRTTSLSEPRLSSRAPSSPSIALPSDSGTSRTTLLLLPERRTPSSRLRRRPPSTFPSDRRAPRSNTPSDKSPLKLLPTSSNSSDKVDSSPESLPDQASAVDATVTSSKAKNSSSTSESLRLRSPSK